MRGGSFEEMDVHSALGEICCLRREREREREGVGGIMTSYASSEAKHES